MSFLFNPSKTRASLQFQNIPAQAVSIAGLPPGAAGNSGPVNDYLSSLSGIFAISPGTLAECSLAQAIPQPNRG
jgi:hypothetical protein